jgi:hypothetical protein
MILSAAADELFGSESGQGCHSRVHIGEFEVRVDRPDHVHDVVRQQAVPPFAETKSVLCLKPLDDVL